MECSSKQVPGRTPLLQLLSDALILAKRSGHDVYNALDLMQNMEVFKVSGLAPSVVHSRQHSRSALCCPLLLCCFGMPHMLHVSKQWRHCMDLV